jgi:hypothetical protein
MAIQIHQDAELCERLKALGYAHRNRIRIDGEEFDLTSHPMRDENGFAIEAISRKSGIARRLRIPLSILQMIRPKSPALLVSRPTRRAAALEKRLSPGSPRAYLQQLLSRQKLLSL